MCSVTGCPRNVIDHQIYLIFFFWFWKNKSNHVQRAKGLLDCCMVLGFSTLNGSIRPVAGEALIFVTSIMKKKAETLIFEIGNRWVRRTCI